MRYKDKVVSNLDAINNQLNSLKNMVQNNSITPDLLIRELEKLSSRINDASEMVSLEDNDFATLRGQTTFQQR